MRFFAKPASRYVSICISCRLDCYIFTCSSSRYFVFQLYIAGLRIVDFAHWSCILETQLNVQVHQEIYHYRKTNGKEDFKDFDEGENKTELTPEPGNENQCFL